MSKQTIFNPDWINPKLNPGWSSWLKRAEGDRGNAECSQCRKTFELSDMGAQAVKSHEASARHKKNVAKGED